MSLLHRHQRLQHPHLPITCPLGSDVSTWSSTLQFLHHYIITHSYHTVPTHHLRRPHPSPPTLPPPPPPPPPHLRALRTCTLLFRFPVLIIIIIIKIIKIIIIIIIIIIIEGKETVVTL